MRINLDKQLEWIEKGKYDPEQVFVVAPKPKSNQPRVDVKNQFGSRKHVAIVKEDNEKASFEGKFSHNQVKGSNFPLKKHLVTPATVPENYHDGFHDIDFDDVDLEFNAFSHVRNLEFLF